MKLIDIYNADEALKTLDNMLLPVKDSLQIMSVIDKLEPELKNYKKMRDKLYLEFGTSDDGVHYVVENTKKKPSNIAEYTKKLDELNNTEAKSIEKETIQLRANIVMKPAHLKALQKVVNVEVI